VVADGPKPRVAVLMGGTTGERAVSMKSGEGVAAGLEERGYRVRRIVVDDELSVRVSPDEADVVFVALHGGAGEDGTLQARLEKMGVPYTGSGPDASRLAMNKIESKRLMVENGILTPAYVELDRDAPQDGAVGAAAKLGFPVVVKPVSEGSTLGITIVRDKGGIQAAVEEALAYGEGTFLESYVAGRELTVGMLGDDPLPIVEISPAREFYDYSAKYKDKGTEYNNEVDLPAGVARAVAEAAVATHRVLGCRDMSRVDMRLSKEGEPFVLELNTIPGLTERSLLPMAAAAAGMSYGELVEKIVLLALDRAKGGSGA
jgi:D-alanine-D-alanine ligase